MLPKLGIIDMINLFGAVQGVFLSAALMTLKRGKRLANRILAAIVMTAVIFIVDAVLYHSRSGISHGITFFYILACIRLLFIHVRKIEDTFSDVEKINLLWLRNIFVIFICTMDYMGLRQPEIFSGQDMMGHNKRKNMQKQR